MINKLTLEQEKQLLVYKDKWLAIGLSTNRIDRKKSREEFLIFNKIILGNQENPIVIFMDSPITTWLATLLLYNFYYNKVESQVESQVELQVWSQVELQVESQVWSQVRSQVESQVWSQVRSQVGSQVRNFVWSYLNGNLWAGYFGFYDFCNKVLGIQFQVQEKWDLLLKTSDVSLIYPFKDFIVISEKPINIKIKNMVLHNETGPSISYADGFCLYSLNGVRVSKELVETPAEQLDPQLIIKEQNAEVRREIVRKIGIERVCQKLNAKTIEKSTNGMYELLLLDIGDRKRPYLKMRNPSIGTYHIEGVLPEIDTIEKALNFRKPKKLRNIPISENGEDWYQQGDVCVYPKNAKFVKPFPTILT